MKIVIYHTSDVHGQVMSIEEIGLREDGLTKALTLIEHDRKKYDASLLLEGGDLIQGSVYANFLSERNKGKNPILQLTKEAKYDAYVLGNHEFSFGQEYLKNTYGDVSNKVLTANIEGLDLPTKPYQIFSFEDFRIGVIGMTTCYTPNYEEAENVAGISFLDAVTTYQKYEKELEEKADLIIVLYHGGFETSLDGHFTKIAGNKDENQAGALLQVFESIDIVLSGHQHRGFITKVDERICAQPKNFCQNIVKIIYDTKLKSYDYELIELQKIENNIDKKYEEIIKPTQGALNEYFDEIIVQNEEAYQEEHFLSLFEKIIKEETNAEFVLWEPTVKQCSFDKKIRYIDVVRQFPASHTIKVLSMKGKEMASWIESERKKGDEGAVLLGVAETFAENPDANYRIALRSDRYEQMKETSSYKFEVIHENNIPVYQVIIDYLRQSTSKR